MLLELQKLNSLNLQYKCLQNRKSASKSWIKKILKTFIHVNINKQIRQQINIPRQNYVWELNNQRAITPQFCRIFWWNCYIYNYIEIYAKGNNSCISKGILIKIHVHHPTSYSVKFHEIWCIPYQGTNSLKFRQSNGNNSCISETIVTNFDVHLFVCLIWFFTSQSTIFRLCWGRSSWVEPVLSSRTQHSDAGEAPTCNSSISSQALYHWATVLPLMCINIL